MESSLNKLIRYHLSRHNDSDLEYLEECYDSTVVYLKRNRNANCVGFAFATFFC